MDDDKPELYCEACYWEGDALELTPDGCCPHCGSDEVYNCDDDDTPTAGGSHED